MKSLIMTITTFLTFSQAFAGDIVLVKKDGWYRGITSPNTFVAEAIGTGHSGKVVYRELKHPSRLGIQVSNGNMPALGIINASASEVIKDTKRGLTDKFGNLIQVGSMIETKIKVGRTTKMKVAEVLVNFKNGLSLVTTDTEFSSILRNEGITRAIEARDYSSLHLVSAQNSILVD